MKNLPEVKALLQGESPLAVFNCSSILSAHIAFIQLRQYYDFPYWVATVYRIPDIQNKCNFVFLRLNKFQSHVIDTFSKNTSCGHSFRYIISKSFGPCGLTTCVQAYIFWLQNRSFGNSITIADDKAISSLLDSIRFNIICPSSPSSHTPIVPNTDSRCFFYSYIQADDIRDFYSRYIHLAICRNGRIGEGICHSQFYIVH